MFKLKLIIIFLGLFIAPIFVSAGTIINPYYYAWSNNVGYINFKDVLVSDSNLTGSAWSTNTGYINFAPTLGGVLNDGQGNLSGFAWGEGLGWIDFNGVNISTSTGRFSGQATGTLVGTLTFDCPDYCDVRTDWPSSSIQCTDWVYSNWSGCSGGVQSRTILSSSPSGCSGGSPVLTQNCSSNLGGSTARISSVLISTTTTIITVSTSTPITSQTYIPSFCSPYLTGYIKLNNKNNPVEVKKLQTFLNTYEGNKLVVDGIYKTVDYNAVKTFQVKYRKDVLDFWNLKSPTGFVYISTQKAINRVYCERTKGLTCPYFTQTTAKMNTLSAKEVLKIRDFLARTQSEKISTSSVVYNQELLNAVRRYQSKYSEDILKPWDIIKPTGLWYQSTRKFADGQLGCYYPIRLDNGVILQ